jgi:hypothetical protein
MPRTKFAAGALAAAAGFLLDVGLDGPGLLGMARSLAERTAKEFEDAARRMDEDRTNSRAPDCRCALVLCTRIAARL